jgi:HEAT repeat protein
MRHLTRILALTALLAFPAFSQQQPQVVNAKFTTAAVTQGLAAQLAVLEKQPGPLWTGYSIPVTDKFSNGWNSDHITYLEGSHDSSRGETTRPSQSFDHTFILLRIANGDVEKLRLELPDRQIDAGNLPFIWLTGVSPEDSIATLNALVLKPASKHLRDSAILAIALHDVPAATPALISLTASSNDLGLREKAAFWLANQRGRDGFLAIQRLLHEDADPAFREKLTFDLTLTKDPEALPLLIRTAHEDASPRVRKQAQFWMAEKGGKAVAGDLRNQAENDPEASLRKSAVFALSRLPKDEAIPQLIQLATTSKDPAVRKQAVFWLGQSDDPRALDYLTKLLKQ